jgi:hypothetical protein
MKTIARRWRGCYVNGVNVFGVLGEILGVKQFCENSLF